MAKNFHNNPFDESTKLKLTIFGECFRAWLPVFIHDPFTDQIFIFDFFAGSGMDSEGTLGSSLILLNEARGEDRKYCSKANKKITFIFNEHNRNNINELKNNVSNHFELLDHYNFFQLIFLHHKLYFEDSLMIVA